MEEETKRRCCKCKAQLDAGEGVTTPRRTVTRSHAHLVDSLATPPSVSRAAVVTTPSTQTTPRTLRPLHDGRRKPRCSDFGPGWHYLFQDQGFFFCSPCDLWDSLPPDARKNISRQSTRYACIANHDSFSHPTSLIIWPETLWRCHPQGNQHFHR